MTKEEHDKIIDFVNSEDYMLLNSYISKPYEETIIEQDKEIERLNNIIKNIKEEIESYIDITIDHLETSNEEINFELRNKCRAMREIKEEIISIIHKELKEGKE